MRAALIWAALILALVLGLMWASDAFPALQAWAAHRQRDFQNAIARLLRALRAGEAGALAALLAVSFGYGVAHAAGPGHGKLVIGGYGMGSRVRLAPLIGIALASSLAQSTTAVALVYGGVALLGWTRADAEGLSDGAFAALSYAAVALVGVWLAWRGAKALPSRAGSGGHGDHHQHQHEHGSDVTCATCGHAHGPSSAQIAGLTGWRDAALLIGAIALRPCTGALFLLILTWKMGIIAAGIAGTYAMGIGTALVTAGFASGSVLLREGAIASLGATPTARVLIPAAQIAAGVAIAGVSAALLIGRI